MNNRCSSPPIQTTATPVRGFLSRLQQLISTAGMVSVDLTDTVFASLPRRDGAPYEAIVKADEKRAA